MGVKHFPALFLVLSKLIGRLPLRLETHEVLRTHCRNSTFKSLLVTRDINRYDKYKDYKSLESLIYKAHFLWDNPLPLHLKRFQLYHTELRNHWPYEYQRSLLYMSDPRKESQACLWRDCKESALSKLQFEKHRWASEMITMEARLPSEQVFQLFQSIFYHYFFLKSHSRLCHNSRKLPTPIVEIPLRPMGNDAADCRIRNLFKKKTSMVWNLLAWENRPLSLDNERLLADIITKSETRSVKRLYQRACRRAYVIKNDSRIPQFHQSEILLRKSL